MNKEIIKYFCIFLGSFLFSLFFFYILGPIYCDEVWVYGFSYNLSKGLMIYRDYNVLQMPLYFLIASVFIKVFGSYIIVMHLFDSLLFSFMMVMLYKMINWKSLILLPIFMFFWPSGYNLLSLFFLILIIYLIYIGKDNDYLIAFIIGLCFITKQNIGVFLFVPAFLYSKNKLKSIFCFIIPFLVLSIYLIFNEAFYEFIDYVFWGMLDFGANNKYFESLFVGLFIVNIVILVYLLFKSKFRDKELFYVLMFQFMMYPIFDSRHYVCASFPFLYLIFKKIGSSYLLKMIGIGVYLLELSLLYCVPMELNFSNGFDFLRNNYELHLLAGEVKEYVGDCDNFFFTDYYSYYIKLYYDIPISQYDLLLNGNVGYKGMEKKFEDLTELCSGEKCYFFSKKKVINEEEGILGNQYGNFYNYIRENYVKVDDLFEFEVYTNSI